jgi:hypothetical protein
MLKTVCTHQVDSCQNCNFGSLNNITQSQPKIVDRGEIVDSGFGAMDNRRTMIACWCHELQEEDLVALENSFHALHIQIINLLVHMFTTMEFLVEQRQGHHQLQDEVATICSEVEELCRCPASPSPHNTSTTISYVSSSPTPQIQVPDLNSPPGPIEVDQEEKDPPNM